MRCAGVGKTLLDDKLLDSEDARLQLARIQKSRVFANSERMRRFLRFIVEMTLAGKQSEIVEYNLGLEVYDRTAEFDPRLSSIVRVDAARLRSKLRDYYETEGRDDIIRIEIPKGKYIPLLTREKTVRRSQPDSTNVTNRSGNTIAIMPFLDLSARGDQWQLLRGLQEELAHSLSRIPELSVVSSISVAALKRRRLDVRSIGARLGLDAIVEGSVRKWNRKFRVVIRLTDTSTGHHLWSEAFERRVGDILAFQTEIATLVSKAVGTKLQTEARFKKTITSPI